MPWSVDASKPPGAKRFGGPGKNLGIDSHTRPIREYSKPPDTHV